MSKARISASIRFKLRDEIAFIQTSEGRPSFSEQIELLLEEAVKARKEKQDGK